MSTRPSTSQNNSYSTTYSSDFKYHHLSKIQKVTPSVARYSTSSYPSGGCEERKSLKSAHGLVGLRNLGNTCFMNSILQCLSNTESLRDYCMEDYCTDLNNNGRTNGSLMEEFFKLIQSMWSSYGREAISAFKFKTQIDRSAPIFVGFKQQDAHELLHYLLDGLHKELRVTASPRNTEESFGHLSDDEKGKAMWSNYLERENSKIVELFGGQLKSTVTCHHCGFCSTVFDPFWTLSLPIVKGPMTTIMDCMRLFTKEDILDGLERVTCFRCKVKRQCSKKFTIQKFPKILVLHLKRFSQAPRTKLFTNVTFPAKNLDLKPFASENNVNAVYNLYAISNHSGTSTKTGHYTAYCRSPVSGEWYNFDDSRVSPICSSKVRSDSAYILFYELAS